MKNKETLPLLGCYTCNLFKLACIHKRQVIQQARLFKRWIVLSMQRKVVSDSQGLVDFAICLVIFVLNLPDEQVLFFGKFKLQKDCNQSCSSKRVLGVAEMTCGLVHASYSLPEWQAVKLTFFAPWYYPLDESLSSG